MKKIGEVMGIGGFREQQKLLPAKVLLLCYCYLQSTSVQSIILRPRWR